MNELWIPAGEHWDLKISHDGMDDAGPFTGGGHKIIWHTTEGSGKAGAISTLRANRDAPHFVIDAQGSVTQCIPLNRAARALEHPGGPETNRANCIQIECVGFAAETHKWSDHHYDHLGALVNLITHRFKVPIHAPVSFAHPHKLSGSEFFSVSGHLGHVHVPGNSHSDPGTGFKWTQLVKSIHDMSRKFQ